MPFPLTSGGAISQFEINDRIRTHLNITMIFPLKPDEMENFNNLKRRWPDVEFKPFYPSGLDNVLHFASKFIHYGWLNRLRVKAYTILNKEINPDDVSILGATTIYRTPSLDPGIRNFVLEKIAQANYDFIQVEFSNYLKFGKHLPKSIQKIFIHHELLFAREASELNILTQKNRLLSRLLKRNRSNEIGLLSHFDKIVTLSEEDKAKLRPDIEEDKLTVSPFVIRGQEMISTKYAFNNTLVFIGGAGHLPNYDGLKWFVTHCWPILCRHFPSLKLLVIGQWNPQNLSWLPEKSNIEFLGFVENLSDVTSNSISIIPIRIGSGIRMKIIETINIGIPFVTTTIGVEGLSFENNRECLVADTPEAFAAAIEQLITHPDFAKKMAEAAKIKLQTHYSYESIIQRRLAVYGKN